MDGRAEPEIPPEPARARGGPTPAELAPWDLDGDPGPGARAHPATRLFRRLWGGDAEEARLRTLCRDLDGVPYAIALAAGRLRGLPLPVCEELIGDAGVLDLLTDPAGERPGYAAVLHERLSALSPGARELVLAVSAFPSWTVLAELRGLLSSARLPEALAAALERDLLRADAAGRLRTPRLVRAYLTRAHPPERLAHLPGVLACLGTRAPEGPPGADEPVELGWPSLLEDAEQAGGPCFLEAVRVCAPWALREGDDADLDQRVTAALGLPATWEGASAGQLTAAARLVLRSPRQEGVPRAVEWLETAVERARGERDVPATLAALRVFVEATPRTGDLGRCRQAMEEGMALAATNGLPGWLARFEAWSGMAAHMAGDAEAAIELGRRALRRARACQDRLGILAAGALLHPFDPEQVGLDPPPPPLSELVTLARALDERRTALALGASLLHDAALAGEPGVVDSFLEHLSEVMVTGGQVIGRVTVGTAVLLAEGAGDAAAALRWAGAIEHERPLLTVAVPRRHLGDLDAALARATSRLGARRAEAERRAGHLLDLSAAHQEIAAWCRARRHGEATDPGLTPREEEVLALVARGLRNKTIAEELAISPKTVMHHTVAIYRKLGVAGRSEASAWAVRAGLA